MLVAVLFCLLPSAAAVRSSSAHGSGPPPGLHRANSMGGIGDAGGKRNRFGFDAGFGGCLDGMVLKGDGCRNYMQCVNGDMVNKTCPEGTAFSRQRKTCEAAVNVIGCHADGDALAENLVRYTQHCRREFLIVGGPDAQSWLKGEVRAWERRLKEEAMSNEEQQSEVKAAAALLKKDGVSKGNYWAAVSQESDGSVKVQSIAKVVAGQDDGDVRIGIPSIISRRALFGKSEGIGGAGRALISGLVNTLAPTDGQLRIGGTPGDEFVNALYHEHGAKNIKASDDPDGVLLYGTLEFRVFEGCAAFFGRAVCGETSAKDVWQHALRFATQTCSSMFPAKLLWDNLTR
eukprot:TRINITY_DN50418_c0_g1_i1.p1 TRINITY_DN50418_c0_g1~~TRINITY_DN50418_c0_g1_i1.p1  ORF type:complete len:345 (-),score=78.93 TRINITY_DN50418_c0_g1_i1:230-1264(-)